MTPPPREVELPEGWFRHDGGFKPAHLESETPIKVMWGDGVQSEVKHAGYFIWHSITNPRGLEAMLDIIAYKPETTP